MTLQTLSLMYKATGILLPDDLFSEQIIGYIWSVNVNLKSENH